MQVVIWSVVVGASLGIGAGVLTLGRHGVPPDAHLPIIQVAVDHHADIATPIDLVAAFTDAVTRRDWATASDVDARLQAEENDAEALPALRDALERGRRRDVENNVTSALPLRLAAWMPNGPAGLGSVHARRGLTIRRDRTQFPLVLVWPRRGQGDDEITAMLAEFPVLDIQGVEIPAEARAETPDLDALIGQSIRFLAGNGLGALAPTVLPTLTALEELDLRGVTPAQTSAFLAAVAGHPRLRRVVCSSRATIGADDILHLASLPALEELTLGGSGSTNDPSLAPLAACAALRVLELSNRQVSAADWRALAGGCPRLARVRGARFPVGTAAGLLALAETDLTDLTADIGGGAELAALGTLRRLTTLQVMLSLPSDQAWSLAGLAPLMAVTDLVLSGSRSEPLTAEESAGIAQLSALRTLRCVGTAWGDAMVPSVAALPQLDRLTLVDAVVSETGLGVLAASRSLTNLTLQRCPRISGAMLSDLATWGALRNVRFDRCPVEEAHLLAMASPGGLTRLAIVNTPVFTTASLDHIATWTFRPQVDLDHTKLDDAGRKRLQDLNRGAIAGTVVLTDEVNDF